MFKNMILGTLLGGLVLCGGGVSPVFTVKADVPELSVYGEAVVEVAPDYAKIYGVVENVSLEGNETRENVVSAYKNIQEKLSNLGLYDGNVSSTYYYEGACNFDGQVILKSSLDFVVQTENMENISEIVSLIANSDYARVKSINYELSNDNAYKEALGKAKQNALEKANSLVNTDGMSVCEIQEECFYYSNSSYKDFVSIEDDLVENIKVKARVKVTICFTQDEANLESEEEEIATNNEEESKDNEDNIETNENTVLEDSSSDSTENIGNQKEESNQEIITINKKAVETK